MEATITKNAKVVTKVQDVQVVSASVRKTIDTISISDLKYHIALFIFMGIVNYIASGYMSYIDELTLRPSHHFPKEVKWFCNITNKPIKYGVLHFVFYTMEFFKDKDQFQIHVGQRITSLWMQTLQHHRNGQHLQMQIETLLQIADCFFPRAIYSSSNGETKYTSILERAILLISASMLVITSILTSMAYHTHDEQMIGLGFAFLKLFFDYTIGIQVNGMIGQVLREAIQIAVGFIALGITIATDMAPGMTPTAMATVIFGAALVAFIAIEYVKLTKR